MGDIGSVLDDLGGTENALGAIRESNIGSVPFLSDGLIFPNIPRDFLIAAWDRGSDYVSTDSNGVTNWIAWNNPLLSFDKVSPTSTQPYYDGEKISFLGSHVLSGNIALMDAITNGMSTDASIVVVCSDTSSSGSGKNALTINRFNVDQLTYQSVFTADRDQGVEERNNTGPNTHARISPVDSGVKVRCLTSTRNGKITLLRSPNDADDDINNAEDVDYDWGASSFTVVIGARTEVPSRPWVGDFYAAGIYGRAFTLDDIALWEEEYSGVVS